MTVQVHSRIAQLCCHQLKDQIVEDCNFWSSIVRGYNKKKIDCLDYKHLRDMKNQKLQHYGSPPKYRIQILTIYKGKKTTYNRHSFLIASFGPRNYFHNDNRADGLDFQISSYLMKYKLASRVNSYRLKKYSQSWTFLLLNPIFHDLLSDIIYG